MSFWGGDKLAAEIFAQKIVTPFNVGQVDCSAYTLTMGAEAYVTPSIGDDLRSYSKYKLSPSISQSIRGKTIKSGGGTVAIPPGQFAFLLTEEEVHMPDNVMGFISLKSRAKFRGLINVSGFHVDPGFTGHLIYSVFNAGPSVIYLTRGEDLFLLWIADLSGNVSKKYVKTDAGPTEIPASLISEISHENYSLKALSDKVEKLSNRVTIITTVATGIVGAATVFGLLVAIWPTLHPSEKPAPVPLGVSSTPPDPSSISSVQVTPKVGAEHPLAALKDAEGAHLRPSPSNAAGAQLVQPN